MSYAVFSIHSPPVEIDSQNRYTKNGRDWIQGGIPLWVAETLDDVEKWRVDKKRELDK